MAQRELTAAEIGPLLDDWLQVEFTDYALHEQAQRIAMLCAADQAFVLDWIQRSAAVNVQVGHMFATQAPLILTEANHRSVEAWILHALDEIDRAGLKPALDTLRDHRRFVASGREHAGGAVYAEFAGVLRNFVHGLSGRVLRLEQYDCADGAYTDSETLFLPAVVTDFDDAHDNFVLAKLLVTMLWAQTRFGTFACDFASVCARYADSARALDCFRALETLRLEAAIARELPGIGREARRLRQLSRTDVLAPEWHAWREQLAAPGSSVHDTLALVEAAYAADLPPPAPFQCALHADAVAAVQAARIAREKTLLRVKLSELLDDQPPRAEREPSEPRLELRSSATSPDDLPSHDLLIDGYPVPLPDDVANLLTSIQLDFGEIPPEHLQPAGPGDYDAYAAQSPDKDPDDVWSGTYHEEGATFYPEWDFRRQHFRKNWCVMREIDIAPVHDDFRAQVLQRYPGLARQLRHTFEALRDQHRLERRQLDGDELDLDALVDAHGDLHAGRDMSERLFMRRHRSERDIAVLFLVDMSGSTLGWINDVQRETLLLLSEALETLGDRYAIYGFSGMTRKKCELYRIKRFADAYDADVQGRISGIRARDYTRMGFAVRHATQLLGEVQARRRLLIVISDGKPDDYTDKYRGPYGIEDTRRALQQAMHAGVRPFCITVDKEARDYLPHLYGAARYTVVDDVARLPYKVADIYRRLTH